MFESSAAVACVELETLPESEPLIAGIDYVELCTGNSRQAAYYYGGVFGFAPFAVSSVETGVRDRFSVVVAQNDIRLVLTSPAAADGEIAAHLAEHGEGVRNIAFRVHDVAEVFDHALRFGARPLSEPALTRDPHGIVLSASVAGYENVVHTLIQRDSYFGDFLPGYQLLPPASPPESTGLVSIDHLAVSVPRGKLEEACEFYQRVFGFHETHAEDVSTEYSAMTSKVVQNSTGTVKFPI